MSGGSARRLGDVTLMDWKYPALLWLMILPVLAAAVVLLKP